MDMHTTRGLRCLSYPIVGAQPNFSEPNWLIDRGFLFGSALPGQTTSCRAPFLVKKAAPLMIRNGPSATSEISVPPRIQR